MAFATLMRSFTRRLSQAVRDGAASQGLAPGDYALVGSFDKRTGRISLTLGTDRNIDETQWFASTLQAIRKAFPEWPQVTMSLGLVAQRVQNLDDVYANFLLGEDEEDLTDSLERPQAHP